MTDERNDGPSMSQETCDAIYGVLEYIHRLDRHYGYPNRAQWAGILFELRPLIGANHGRDDREYKVDWDQWTQNEIDALAKERDSLRAEVARLKAALEQALNAFSHIHEHNDTQVVEGAMTRIGKALEETK